MSGPRVSVVVPMYNAAATVAASIRSLQEQSLTDWEAIVVNDGSTDESAGIVRTIAEDDPRVRLIQQANRGVSAARNAATREAGGEYLYWLDPDDVCLPGSLGALVEAAASNGLGAAAGHHNVVTPGGEVLHEYRLRQRELGLSELIDGCSTRCGSHVVRRDLTLDVRGEPILWDESLSLWEDRDYWMRLAERGVRWGVVDRVVTDYVVGPPSGGAGASLSKRAHEMMRSGERVLRELFARHAGEAGFEPERLARLLEHNALHSASRAAAISGDGIESARALIDAVGPIGAADADLVDAARFGVMYGCGIVPGERTADPVWIGGVDSLWAGLGCNESWRAALWKAFVRATIQSEDVARACLDSAVSGDRDGVVVVGYGQQGRAIVFEAVRRGVAVRVRDDAGLTGELPMGAIEERIGDPVPVGWGVIVSPLDPGGLRDRFGACGAVFAKDVLDGLEQESGWDPAAIARGEVGGIVGTPAPC